jgi:hypothetical protein
VVTDAHITPDLILSGLRLLVDVYKVARERFKDRKAPDRVEEVIIKAEQAKPETVDASEIERRIKRGAGSVRCRDGEGRP